MYQDKTLTCKDCGAEFTFTASEQEFFESKGFQNEPKRCASCRAVKKGESAGPRQRQMYPAVCAACGCSTMVPFQPTGEKPVYCRDCYQAR